MWSSFLRDIQAAVASHDHDFQAHGSGNTTTVNQLGTPSISMAPISTQDAHVMHLVKTASHQMLLQSSNPHYLRLYQENTILNLLLRACMNDERMHSTRINDLRARVSELEGKFVAGRGITSVQGHSKNACIFPLSIPAPSPPLERKDFPNIRFWTAKEWNTYKAIRQRNNETIRKLAFITTSNGEPVTNEYLEQMSETARRLFNELHNHGLAPPTWKAKSQTISDFFINTIVLDFPELRWCEGGRWKAEAFAVTRYPDCSRKFFNTDDSDGQMSSGRTRKKRKTDKRPRPSGPKWPLSPDIDLANDGIMELYESEHPSASCLSLLLQAISDSSVSSLSTGSHGLPPVQPDSPNNSANQNDTIANSQTSIISSGNVGRPVMLQLPLPSPPCLCTQRYSLSEGLQTDDANMTPSNNTHESRSLTMDADEDQSYQNNALDGVQIPDMHNDVRAPSQTAPKTRIVDTTVGLPTALTLLISNLVNK